MRSRVSGASGGQGNPLMASRLLAHGRTDLGRESSAETRRPASLRSPPSLSPRASGFRVDGNRFEPRLGDLPELRQPVDEQARATLGPSRTTRNRFMRAVL